MSDDEYLCELCDSEIDDDEYEMCGLCESCCPCVYKGDNEE